MDRSPRILVSTWSRDSSGVSRVLELLRHRGARVCRFNTDLYPSQYRLSSGLRGAWLHCPDSGDWDLTSLDGLWFRRDFTGFSSPPELVETQALREARDAVRGWCTATCGFVLDPLDRVQRAGHKLWQLRVASNLGLEVPDTLISNDPDRVMEFARDCRGVMAKMHNCDLYLDDDDHPVRIHARFLQPEQVEAFEGWEMGPLIFQRRIPKLSELRVILVEDQVFTLELLTSRVAGAEDDWRAVGEEVLSAARAYILPARVRNRLQKLRRHLGLRYGAVDMIRTPDDRFVFLEYNPVGSFEFLASVYGDDVPSALADCLIRGSRGGR